MNDTIQRARRALATAAARRTARRLGAVTFDDRHGQVCDNACRSAAQRHRNQSAATFGAF